MIIILIILIEVYGMYTSDTFEFRFIFVRDPRPLAKKKTIGIVYVLFLKSSFLQSIHTLTIYIVIIICLIACNCAQF